VLFVGLLLSRSLVPLDALGVASGSFVERLMVVNLILVAFNMIPAFPMDGGRVLRALLAMRIDYARATRIAAGVGQGAAVVLGLIGLFGNPLLLLIALFVWFGAGQESAAVQSRSALGGVPVRRAMLTDYAALDASESIARAVERVLAGSQRDFPVLDRGRFVGVLTQERLVDALSRDDVSVPIGRIADGAVVTVDPNEMLDVAVERMRSADCPAAAVVLDGRTVGLLTLENVGEYLILRRAVGGRNDSHADFERLLGAGYLEPRVGTLRG
jgi:CBS domain-containing protein